MEKLDDMFLAALRFFTRERGAQSRLAKEVDISAQYVWKLVHGEVYGSEETRRKIAAALGYPGGRYEEFLNVGRRELGLETYELPDERSPEVVLMMEKTRRILEEGGPRGEALDYLLNLMEPERKK